MKNQRAFIYILLAGLSAPLSTQAQESGFEGFDRDGIFQIFTPDGSLMLVAGGTSVTTEAAKSEPEGFHGVWYLKQNGDGVIIRDTENGLYLADDGTMGTTPSTVSLSANGYPIINSMEYQLASATCDAYASQESIMRVKGNVLPPDNPWEEGSYLEFPSEHQNTVYVIKNLKTLEYLSLHNGSYKAVGGGSLHHQPELNKNAFWKFNTGYYQERRENGTVDVNRFNGVHGLYAVAEPWVMESPALSQSYFYGSLLQGEDGFYYSDTDNHNDYDSHIGIDEQGCMIFPTHEEWADGDKETVAWIVRPYTLDLDALIPAELQHLKDLTPVKSAEDCAEAEYGCQAKAWEMAQNFEYETSEALTALHKIYMVQSMLENCYHQGNILQNKADGKYLALNRDNSYTLYASDDYKGLENQFRLNNSCIGYDFVVSSEGRMSFVSDAPAASGEYYLLSGNDQMPRMMRFVDVNRPGSVAFGYDSQYFAGEQRYLNGTSYADAGMAAFYLDDSSKTFLAFNADGRTCASSLDDDAAWWNLKRLSDDETMQLRNDVIDEMYAEIHAAFDDGSNSAPELKYVNLMKMYRDDREKFDAEYELAQDDWQEADYYYRVKDELDTEYSDDYDEDLLSPSRLIPTGHSCMEMTYGPRLADTYARLRHASDGNFAACGLNAWGAYMTKPLDLFDAGQIWAMVGNYSSGSLYNYNTRTLINHRSIDGDIRYAGDEPGWAVPFVYDYTDALYGSINSVELDADNYSPWDDPDKTDHCHIFRSYIRYTPDMVFLDVSNPMRPQLLYAKSVGTGSNRKQERGAQRAVALDPVPSDVAEMLFVDALPSTLQEEGVYDMADCLWQLEDHGGLKVKMNTVGSDAWATIYLPFSTYLPDNVSAYTAEFEKNETGTEVSFNLYKTRYFDAGDYDYEWDEASGEYVCSNFRDQQFGINRFVGVILRANGGVTEVELPMRDNNDFNFNDYATFYPTYHGLADDCVTYPYDNNILKGVTKNTPYNYTNFKREDLRVLSKKNNVVGFYVPNASSYVLEQNKCYININDVLDDITLASGSRAESIRFNLMEEDGVVTYIRGTETEAQQFIDAIYDLAGQRIDRPQQGVNIINSKKVLVK